ncbi:EAL domain-containing protein [Sulfurivirga sp.]|uniref:EAL domain-containing protein n=1 Tax=Sulfurivirga sp. TaxID=2614236 RepID=UPI0025F38F17|nr:EAL domain-containing protein [Sulfurivirga sp.]
MIRWLSENTLISRLRRIFLLLLVMMILLLAFQLDQAFRILNVELSKGQQHVAQVVDKWLEAERLLMRYKLVGSRVYTRALSSYLENGREGAIPPALAQLARQYDLTGTVFISDDGQGWNSAGDYADDTGLPGWLAQLQVGQANFLVREGSAEEPLFRKAFDRPGLYAVARTTVHYDIGEPAGELIFISRLAEAGHTMPVLEKLLGSPAVRMMLHPPASVQQPLTLLEVGLQPYVPFWVRLPERVQDHRQAGLMVSVSTDFYTTFLNSALVAVLLPFVIFFFILLGLYLYLNRHVVKPMGELARTFRAYRHGQLEARMSVVDTAPEEVRYVAEQTNRTLEELTRQTQALHALNQSLEQQVAERTRALEEANAHLREIAFVDSLTGLHNRLGLEQHWHQRYERAPHHAVALAVLDIDLFRDLNEAYGTEVANRVLKKVAVELNGLCGGGYQSYRLHADTFALLFPVEDFAPEQVTACLQDIVTRFAERRLEDLGIRASLSLSAGWVWVDEYSALPFNVVLRQATQAMRAAKLTLDEKVQRYDPDRHAGDDQASPEQLERIRAMIRTGEGLELYGQPLVEARTGEWRYVEVLARFEPEPGQQLSPAEFMPLVSRLHQEAAFDAQVIHRISERLHEKGCPMSGLSINLSPEALAHEALFEWLAPLAELTDRYKIVLEITESTLVQDLKAAQEKLSRLREMGFRVAIDDFGSGYSSISYLAHLPADIIKFDRALALAACTDSRNERIILGLARELHTLGYEVVFEGIEDQHMAGFFRRPYIDYLQGFHFSRPLSCETLCVPVTPM